MSTELHACVCSHLKPLTEDISISKQPFTQTTEGDCMYKAGIWHVCTSGCIAEELAEWIENVQ